MLINKKDYLGSGRKNPLSIPEEGLELFREYDPCRPGTAEMIYDRIRQVQRNHKGKIYYSLLEDHNIGNPRMTMYPLYREIRKGFGPGKVFVDAGCGLGENLRKAIRDGISPSNAIGITINPWEIEWGYELYDDKKEPDHSGLYLTGDLLNVPLDKNSVDFCNASSIIHTMGKREWVIQFIKEAKRVLKPGGFFFGRTWGSEYEKESRYFYQPSEDALESYLKNENFEDIRFMSKLEKMVPPKFTKCKINQETPKDALSLYFIATA